MARIAAVFGVVALALAAIGLYGVLSFNVARRRNEIGIRIALGAEPRRVIRMILAETSFVLIAGLVIGVVAMAAAYLPARRAARLDPMLALRQE
jgi:ABC-type antimicrobial peptide transport system permease subunit